MSKKKRMTILTDTGFWIALYNKKENERHEKAIKIYEWIIKHRINIYIPWPIFYEILRNKLALKTTNFVKHFENGLKTLNFTKIDDDDYREAALEETIQKAKIFKNSKGSRTLSLVDIVTRGILLDKNEISNLITLDPDHFEDVCKKKNVSSINNVEMLSGLF